MISLEKNKKFQEDYKNWKQVSEQITNLKAKAELDNLLEQILKTVRNIDSDHSKLSMQHMIPDAISDSRQRLAEIRSKIQKIVKDYENSIK